MSLAKVARTRDDDLFRRLTLEAVTGYETPPYSSAPPRVDFRAFCFALVVHIDSLIHIDGYVEVIIRSLGV